MNKVIGHGILFVLVVLLIYLFGYSSLFTLGILSEIPNNSNLLNWDASWYYSIGQKGYFLDLENQCNAGFFPGFPYLWKSIGLPPIGISIFNFIFFVTGVYLLKIVTNSSWVKALFIISLPSIFFFLVPYSESIFYLFGVLFIIAWVKKKLFYVILFALILSFIRPVFFFLIPAIIGLFLLKKKYSSIWKPSIFTIIALILGAALGFTVIGLETGDFFAYSKSQVIQWEHEFKIPSYPLTTWRGYRILWLDGLALFLSVLSVLILFIEFYRVRIKGKETKLSDIEIIGLGYLFMILIYVLFFHPVEDGRTTILSMNRYVFCNPFLHFIFLKRIGKVELNANAFLKIFVASIFVALLIGFPFYSIVELNYSSSLIFSLGLMIFFIILSINFFKVKYNRLLLITTSIVFFLLQLYLFNSFLKGNWIG